MPTYRGIKLRRHGDIIQRTVGGYYIVHGRADDNMNLGGIKTSSVEIELVCNNADENVLETAANSIKSRIGGPEQLVVLAALKNRLVEFDTKMPRIKFQKSHPEQPQSSIQGELCRSSSRVPWDCLKQIDVKSSSRTAKEGTLN